MRKFSRTLKPWQKSLLYLALAILVVWLFTSALIYAHFFGPVDRYAGQVQFVVQPDETTDQISDTLKSEGFIRSRLVFDVVLHAEAAGHTVVPGGYNLSASMDVWSIAGALLQPPPMVFFSFPPGWRK